MIRSLSIRTVARFATRWLVVFMAMTLVTGVVEAAGPPIDTFGPPTPNSQPWMIVAGPDGNLWFTEYGANKIGKSTPAGVISEFNIPTANSGAIGITVGADGNLWFAESAANKIGRITTAGVITEFNVPTGSSEPRGITQGPAGTEWLTE